MSATVRPIDPLEGAGSLASAVAHGLVELGIWSLYALALGRRAVAAALRAPR